jgi:hypothetical protein
MQTVNRSFGTVRRSRVVTDVAGSVQGLPSDYAGGYGSYAMATGAEDRIATLQDEIAAALGQEADAMSIERQLLNQ